MNKTTQTLVQVALVCVAMFAAYMLSQRNSDNAHAAKGISSVPEAKAFDMLQYVNEKIAQQECNKDVRCWSSVSKFQMFAAGASIEHDALGIRIEQYHKLIGNIWDNAAASIQGTEISPESLSKVLTQMFPSEQNSDSGDRQFSFSEHEPAVLALSNLIEDYSDTIESWRLLQSWASQKTDESGAFSLTPAFSKEAIDTFQDFLVSFDIAVLKRAKEIAFSRKLSVVDAKSMELAFEFDAQKSK